MVKNGIIEIFLKNKEQDSIYDFGVENRILIYSKDQTEASYNGNFDNFVQQNTLIPSLKLFYFNDKNEFNVDFVVTKYNELEKIHFQQKYIPLNVQKEVERLLLLSSGNWKHCTQNGSNVNCYNGLSFEY